MVEAAAGGGGGQWSSSSAATFCLQLRSKRVRRLTPELAGTDNNRTSQFNLHQPGEQLTTKKTHRKLSNYHLARLVIVVVVVFQTPTSWPFEVGRLNPTTTTTGTTITTTTTNRQTTWADISHWNDRKRFRHWRPANHRPKGLASGHPWPCFRF